jgi:hypothetical protein
MEFREEETHGEHRRPKSQRRLHTVRQFCQAPPAFTLGGMRWFLFHRQTNGLERAVVKVGRRILIDEEKFFGWLDAQSASQQRLPH